jgi:DNA-binding protein WhiA
VSFAEDVRAELCETLPRADHCRLAQLAGLLRFAGAFHLQGRGDVHVRLDLGSPAAARRAVSLLRERGAICEVRTYHERRFARHTRFQLVVGGDARSLQVLHEAGALAPSLAPAEELPPRLVARSCCRRSYLRGAFLAAGSISGPRSGAHLEWRASSRRAAEEIARVAHAEGFILGVHERPAYAMAYAKRLETVRDLLAALGAHGAELRLEEEAVLRATREQVNRLTNADEGNIGRQAAASSRQRAAIAELGGPERLDPELRTVAELRVVHPEATLSELALLARPPLSRAAVAGRLRRIVARADSDP